MGGGGGGARNWRLIISEDAAGLEGLKEVRAGEAGRESRAFSVPLVGSTFQKYSE